MSAAFFWTLHFILLQERCCYRYTSYLLLSTQVWRSIWFNAVLHVIVQVEVGFAVVPSAVSARAEASQSSCFVANTDRTRDCVSSEKSVVVLLVMLSSNPV